MKKIISLFQRNYDTDRLVRDEVVPGAEWVVAGEGVATRKWDGTCCMVLCGVFFKRYDVKKGKYPPPDFMPAQEHDPTTGHWPGWVPVTNKPEDQYHIEAWQPFTPDGTYELLGPKIQGNAEHASAHVLMPHGVHELPDAPRDFAGLREYFLAHDIEGIVWWRNKGNPDCDKVKIKAKDFGITRHG